MSISIIIPTLNEEKYLRKTIQQALNKAENPDKLEVIVIDAGSTDKTLEAVQGLPIVTYVKNEFKLQKHESLNFGLKQAIGDIVLFLDADTLLPVHFDAMIHEALAKERNIGGAFEMRFVNPDFKLYALSLLNSLRYNIWKTCYGDQAIFCKKATAEKLGGFDDTLMEAAHFCRSLSAIGRLEILKEPVLTSPRRFVEEGFWKVFWFDVKMWFRFVLGLELKKPKTSYWKTNLQNG